MNGVDLKGMNRRRNISLKPAVLIWVLCFLTLAGLAAPGSNARAQQADGAAKQVRDGELGKSLEMALASERESYQQLQEELKGAERIQKAVDAEVSVYKTQVTAYGNLLHLPTTSVDALQTAGAAVQATMDEISQRLNELTKKQASFTALRQQVENQYSMDSEQLSQMKAGGPSSPETRGLLKTLQALTKLLSSKLQVIDQLIGAYGNQIENLKRSSEAFGKLSEQFDKEIEARKARALFSRESNPLEALQWKGIHDEGRLIAHQLASLLTGSFWEHQLGVIWESGRFLLIAFLFLLGIVGAFLFRLRRYLHRLEEHPFFAGSPLRRLGLDLFQRSLPLMGIILFIFIYAKLRHIYPNVPAITVTLDVLLIWLLTRWGLHFLELLQGLEGAPVPDLLGRRVRILLVVARVFGISYVILEWPLQSLAAVLIFARLALEIFLIVWSVSFWRAFQLLTVDSFLTRSRLRSGLRALLIGLGYIVAVAGLVFELAGYGQLALYWYASWGTSLIVLVWVMLLFFMLWELETGVALGFPPGQSRESAAGTHYIRWLLFRLLWLCWFFVVSVAVMIAWGVSLASIIKFLLAFNYPIPIGEMHFRLLGVVYAVLVLILTYAAGRLWRRVLIKRVLAQSGMEMGLQESITTISVYVLWVFGILASLHALGISTASLTVGFGALGIGLGFGLQNIFNNFISGLILLFERPIQVGDVVEVKGTWGTITKINVRSTVVQTFENASLIIPNSEFISSQVINWSFKDVRVRRTITIGVAYGSDLELVRKTLLEVADKHPLVLKYPKADVLFVDFADSSLTFKLRVWTTLKDRWVTDSDIRYEIDRLFKERKIELPFPQRDIHVRSIETKLQVEPLKDGDEVE
jgi:potassium efflux system protein